MMKNLSLFPEFIDSIPLTEGIKYAGSKLKLLPYILNLARRVRAKTILDGFSGSTRVAQAFAKSGYRVICNDIAIWSQVFAKCYLENQHDKVEYAKLIRCLNEVAPKDGWFTEHYGGKSRNGSAVQADGLKKPWQIHNTRKLDGIREEIDRLSLSPIEQAVALTSLIIALDRVDNTIGHFVSYLNKWSSRSYNDLILKVPSIFVTDQKNEVLKNDVFDICGIDADLAYFDPPYGSNNEKMPSSRVRYASYYHLWTTVCLNDTPELFGKAKRRCDTSDKVAGSVFEEFRRNPETGRFIAVESLERLIQSTSARWIILSYNSGRRGTAEEINKMLSESGKIVDVIKVDYKCNVMASMKWTHEWLCETEFTNYEFLFLIDKH
nr:DNA adenine methylase [Candidatus Synechococcus spongiarum]